MIFETRHLRIIKAIAETGSVTGAEKRLHITQPAISRSLKKLEIRLGVCLFERLPTGMIPTPACTSLLVTSEKVLRELAQAEEVLAMYRDGRLGVLRVTTECYTSYTWLLRLMPKFSQEFPDVELQIDPTATEDPVTALRSGQIDLAMTHLDHPEDDLESLPLFSDELVAVVSPRHQLAHRSHVDAEEFRDLDLIVHSNWGDSIVRRDFLEPERIEPRSVTELRLTDTVLEGVRAGLGIAVIPQWIAVAHLAGRGGIVSLRLGDRGLLRTWSATRLSLRRSRPLEGLVNLLRREVALTFTDRRLVEGSRVPRRPLAPVAKAEDPT